MKSEGRYPDPAPRRAPRTALLLGGGVVLGLVGSVPYQWSARSTEAPPLWLSPLLIFLFAGWIGWRLPGRAPYTFIAVGSGLPLITVLVILVDTMRDASSHNLFPFEIVFSLILSYPAALFGAYLGTELGAE